MGLCVEDVATEAAVAAIELTDTLPRRWNSVGDQLTRAASSTLLNIAEACGRSGKDSTYHFRVAYGSARETLAAIKLLGRLKAIPRQEGLDAWYGMDRVARMLWPLTRRR